MQNDDQLKNDSIDNADNISSIDNKNNSAGAVSPEEPAGGPDELKQDPPLQGQVVDNIEAQVESLVAEFIDIKCDGNIEQLTENNGMFVSMLKYIYRYYLAVLLDNNKGVNNRYDYKVLDKLFWIYTDLVYKYKKNKQPNIIEFTLFTSVNRELLYNIRYGNIKKASLEDIRMVKSWFSECENSLINNGDVKSIFLLKAQYRYNDNLAPLPVEYQAAGLGVNELPDLSAGSQKLLKTSKQPPVDQ